MEELEKKLRKTSEYKKVCDMLDTAKQLDLDNMQSEIESLHLGRKMRNLRLKTLSADRLIDVACQEASSRSRLIEIVLGLTRNFNMLELAHQAATETLISKYYKELPGTTKASKSAFVYDIMSDLKIKLTEFKSVIEIANLVVSDIDKAGFSIKHIVELLQTANRREHLL